MKENNFMPPLDDSPKKEHPSTYVVQDRSNEEELLRLTLQDRMATIAMGGLLPEQADPISFRRVLDVACGTGGWLIAAAQAYPGMSLIGIDVSRRMIEYAHEQAEAQQVSDRVEFHTMDALRMLEFPNAYFDLVNMRFATSFLRTWDWPKMLSELLRVTCPGGVVRLTEGEVGVQSNSPALMRFFDMMMSASYQAGHLFTQERAGMTSQLARLLQRYGCQQVQTKAYSFEQRAGTPEGQEWCENVKSMLHTVYPFLQKWGSASKEYQAICQQVLEEMERPDFLATTYALTAWGRKPE
jgi:ubiquinone/menaquinone biosynthesis C-methylase UbiE